MANKSVAIVGAGLIGSFLAIALKKRGLNVDLFEKRSDMRVQSNEGARSINLVLTSRGIEACKRVDILEELNTFWGY